MLKRVERQVLKDENDICVLAKDAKFPSPFEYRLEFSCSARGPWNIAHTGMLIPEAHEVFVCAQSCLRGVVLTAAEMNAIDRFSNIFWYLDIIIQIYYSTKARFLPQPE